MKKSIVLILVGVCLLLSMAYSAPTACANPPNAASTYNYNNDGSRKEAVTPPSKRFVFIGCFLSFGTDRSQEAINNNL